MTSQDLPDPQVGAPDDLAYRLITGPDDAEFCRRVSAYLEQGYAPHGGPALTVLNGQVIAAQALVFVGLDDDECCGEGCCS